MGRLQCREPPEAWSSKLDETARPQVTLVAHEVGPIGGMEQMLSTLVQGLLWKGFEVTVVARSCDLAPHPHLRWARVPGPARPFVLAYAWFFVVGSLVTWIRRRGVVNTTGAVIFNRADVSTVHYCHHGSEAKTSFLRASRPGLLYRLNAIASARMSRMAERFSYRPNRTRRLVAVSRGVAAELSRLPASPKTIDVITNGVDRHTYQPDLQARHRTRSELDIGEEELVALFVGGDWERKGLVHALEAVASSPEWNLIVVGPGDVDRYRRRSDETSPGRVSFTGEQRDTENYYAAADVFIFPSAYEAFPISLLEAASSGLVLLATPVNGAVDLVVEGHNGWLIQRDGSVIAERLRELADDRVLVKTMGAAARESTADLTWEQVVESYVRLYRAAASA